MDDNFDFDFEDDDDFDLASLGRLSPERFPLHKNLGSDEDKLGVGTQHRPRPSLRSRPQIDFAARHSNVDSLPPFSTASRSQARSGLSGSMPVPHSNINSSKQHRFSRGMYASSDLDSSPSPRVPLELIASLTVTELNSNPHYRRLHEKYERLTEILTTYAERGITMSVMKNDTFVPEIYQAPPGAGSRASSLGPSDSASQRTRIDLEEDRAIELLLETVEPSSLRPSFLPLSVLWYYDDCKKDTSAGIIITANNRRRPKMSLAIRRPNGTPIEHQEYANVRHSADIIVQNLVKFVDSDPRTDANGGNSKSRTKTFVKNLFSAEYRRAILELEAEQKLLRLCSFHWKADAMIGQAFLRRNEIESKAAMNRGQAPSSGLNPSDANGSQPDLSPTAPIPQVLVPAPMNVAKHALELSPGPKSPSVSHAQKRSKDNLYPGQKTTCPQVPSNSQKHPAARNIVPTFLQVSRTEATSAELAPMNLHPVNADTTADNLIAILKSEFPSLTNAPSLLNSMNAQLSFKQGETSESVTTLLERVQSADPGSPDIDEDNMGQSWGHYQFTAGGISPSSSLTSWEDVGSVAMAFKLIAAAIKTCREARVMCANAGTPKTTGFISNVYLEKILECLESCWVGAGGIITSHSRPAPVIPTTPPSRDIKMSSPARVLKIKFKPLALIANTDASNTPNVPAGTDTTSSQQPASSAESTQGPSTVLDEGARADITSLKLLHVPELMAWMNENKLIIPKSKRKDDLIVAIVKSSEFAQVSKSIIEKIVEQRKLKKGPQKQIAALP
ncbi:hypothetical protein H4582DRAFT_2090797 [Lactarius indigo]|nr:hypothetical protein H4582DRAFT_2090797 [Lactarius indigo]